MFIKAWAPQLLKTVIDSWDCAVSTTDEEFREREYRLNCLNAAFVKSQELLECFKEAASREILDSLQIALKSTTTCDLLTRIATLCDALRSTMLEINMKTGIWLLNIGTMLMHG